MKTRMFRSFRRRRQAEMQQIKPVLLNKEFSYLDLKPKRLLVRLLQNHNLSKKAKKNTVFDMSSSFKLFNQSFLERSDTFDKVPI